MHKGHGYYIVPALNLMLVVKQVLSNLVVLTSFDFIGSSRFRVSGINSYMWIV